MIARMLLEGLIYALVLAVIVTGSQLVNPRLWLNCYPKAIQAVVPERTKGEMRAKLLVGIPFMLIMFGYPVYSTFMLKANLGSQYTYWIGLINMIVIQNAFNIFDLLILDWLIFVAIKPKYLELEGTGGMKEYGDYMFHLKGARKGFILSVAYGALAAVFTLF